MDHNLRDLLKQERFLRKKFDTVRNFLHNFDADQHNCQLDVRLQRLEETFNEFQIVRQRIELLAEEESEQTPPEPKETEKEWAERVTILNLAREEENWKVLSEMEEIFCTLKGEIMSLKQHERRSEPTVRSSTTEFVETSVGLSRVKLPDIRLPTFSGQLKEWMIFRDNFQNLIHRNNQLMPMDKFTYLRSSLMGEALKAIDSVELSAVNYEVAWTLLQNRYENRKLIVKAYLDALFAGESMKKESYDSLNRLISDFEMNLMMLDKVGEPTANWSTLLVHMMCTRLDGTTLRHWESHHNSKDVPSYEKLIQFLRNHCSVLQSVAGNKPVPMEDKRSKICISHTTTHTFNKCFFCGEAFHSAFRCMKFLKMKTSERVEISRRHALCLNCLSPGHQARVCNKGSCHHCRQKHHSLLHTNSYPVNSSVAQSRSQTTNQQQLQTPRSNLNQPIHTQTTQTRTNSLPVIHSNISQSPTTTNQSCTCRNTVALPVSTKTHSKEVLLSTAIVRVVDRFGNTQLARALLDSCSQFCFMTVQFCQKLSFIQKPKYLTVQGIGGSKAVSRKIAVATIASRSDQISTYNSEMKFFVLPELTVSLPTSKINVSHWRFPEDIVLADPTFFEPGRVDIIIGAEHYYDLLEEGRMRLADDSPVLQNSVFGWIVSGSVPVEERIQQSTVAYTCTLADVHNQLTKFWEVETCRSNSIQSVEETECENLFDQTTTRDKSGRFVVSLPKKEFVIKQLGESRNTAMKRLTGMERRFQSNPGLQSAYREFMSDYERRGHMRQVNEPNDEAPVYYLPHHAVLKPDSTTTKLRVVFDASCKTTTGVSLNDALMVGPVVQDDLLSIVIRFRFHKIAIVADIEKMYRMIQMQCTDQRLQRILWRDSSDAPILTYELSTVTYGTAAAPYLATKCLKRLAQTGRSTYPHAAEVLEKDFYMDDQLTGTENLEEGKQLIREMQELMASGGFILRKWNSNCRTLLEDLPADLVDDRATFELDSSNSPVKTLGLLREPRSDKFLFTSPKWNSETVFTKRIVLADAARLFDPLGLVGPVVVLAKIFLQEIWKRKCDWDDPLPDDMQSFWMDYRRNLRALSSLSVPRWVQFSKNLEFVEIHGFCDASDKAYGACIYLRCTSSDGSVEVNLITAKSKVAPLEDLK
ncbi:uncharacterized protein LOC129773023 [Toxorhynchites rutilus septentrionalis]|uniref:uncharacterized protein LOC129773023 n=1 Tax=Toxorhynchites rutilus septentrionalis TaxID=329112 RepID=UPI00247AD55B|nr:uncharacterized protein LOC129773023 [Toxorhynchites rutilus septentrionalis]